MSQLDRRDFLGGLAAALMAGRARAETRETPFSKLEGDELWARVRDEFDLSEDEIHMSAMLLASHPRPVREAIERHRRGLDRNPVTYLEEHNARNRHAVRRAAGDYLEVDGGNIILTDSTTMGLALVYNGLRLEPGNEILTTGGDYYVTHEAVRLAAERTGATVRQLELARQFSSISVDEIVENITRAITPRTRVLALTWVHSGTGLKLPLEQIAEAVAATDRDRAEHERVLLCVDGVHGLGIEALSLRGSRIDFFVAGCHKWLFGPRGTGIVWGNRRAWPATRATIPSFIDGSSWQAWIHETEPREPTTPNRMMPGGFKPFEHQWAMAEAFGFHQMIGKQRVAERTHTLATSLKEGLAEIDGVKLITPMATELSSGIVCFDARGWSAAEIVRRLRRRKIIASVTPYATRYARLTPSIRNTPDEAARVLEEVARVV